MERPCISKYWNFPKHQTGSLALFLDHLFYNLLLIRSFTTGSGAIILSRWGPYKHSSVLVFTASPKCANRLTECVYSLQKSKRNLSLADIQTCDETRNGVTNFDRYIFQFS